MWSLLLGSAFANPAVGEVAVGLWPLRAPTWQLVHEDLDAVWYPEPTVFAAVALGSDHRTSWQFGAQIDGFHREWRWRGEPFDATTAVRFEGRVGARTELGPRSRDRTDPWLEYGGGWVTVPARTPEHRLYTQQSPTLYLNLGVARGLGALRPFAMVEGRLGWPGGGIPGCDDTATPCYSTLEFPGGPGLGLVVGLTH